MGALLWDSEALLALLLNVIVTLFVFALIARISLSQPGLALLAFFFLIYFSWRLVSVFYIDVFGPVVSEQLERSIGPGLAAVPLGACQVAVLLMLVVSFHPLRLKALAVASDFRTSSLLAAGRLDLFNLVFWVVVVFEVALWIEMLTRGPVPLFSKLERLDYSKQYGGFLHGRLMDWGPMLAFQLGLFFATPVLRGMRFDCRFGALFGSLMVYLLFVGHRFSSFFLYFSFFIMPLGSIVLGRSKAAGFDSSAFFRTLRALWLPVVGLGVLVLGALIYSYAVVRGAESELLQTKLTQRLLVQQGEMWWMTYERVFLHGDWNTALALFKLFVDPFNPNRNSTMQLLMELGLPVERAHTLFDLGVAYTGGWPEIFFELGGPVDGFVLVVLSAVMFSEFLFLLTRCVVQERYATCFFLTPILYAVEVNLASGMLNSFVQLTFMTKLGVAIFVYVLEGRWRARVIASTSLQTDRATVLKREVTP
ncbi:DUF6418 domain-containing protein [Bradyrhizobium sp. LTSP849]|uniref:DUF6418 domain-containing protein n=1 Tax=Bradyrhizobium sp. LTSP849 TaxID=1615890 RepID=UPI000ABF4A4B|nr:DUF6418 domain-containing protein [Bradyrhizobium sp. LTSP849]